MVGVTSQELDQLRAIKKAALQLLPYLPKAQQSHVPSNNLRVALGLLGRHETPRGWSYEAKEIAAIAKAFED